MLENCDEVVIVGVELGGVEEGVLLCVMREL